MSDVGKDPIPIIKESVRLAKKMKKLKYFGQVLEKLIIIYRQKTAAVQ